MLNDLKRIIVYATAATVMMELTDFAIDEAKKWWKKKKKKAEANEAE